MPIPILVALVFAVLLALLGLLAGLSLRFFGVRRQVKRISKICALAYLVIFPFFLFVASPLILSSLIAEASTRPQDRSLTDTPSTFGRTFEEVRFQTPDGLWLEGWYLAGEEKKAAIILAHGLFRNRQEVLERACLLNQQGYPALLFDLRGHGSSQSARVTLGWKERLDVIAAARFLRQERGREEVILLGVSMGAVAAIEAATEIQDSLEAVVADSPFANLYDTVARHTKLYLRLPAFPFATLFTWNFSRLGGFQAANLNPGETLRRLNPTAVLLIYGSEDERMPSEVAHRLYDSISSPRKQLLFFENAGHGAAFRSDPEKYVGKVLEFLASG